MTLILKATGARVNHVDEEGEVSVFCYSIGRSYSFRVPPDEAKAWGALLGEYVTVQIVAAKYIEPIDTSDDAPAAGDWRNVR